LDNITTQDWNALVQSVGSVGDLQSELLRIQSQIGALTDTLVITNIILGVIAITFIISVVLKFRNK
jgi:hypothetical protein